ncbi:MAG: hypothetical protein U9R17_19170 [Thermodesulfobacteriota bacterium]|nr:hypothetical protein [Thermodesulfobacteriota bacterium]
MNLKTKTRASISLKELRETQRWLKLVQSRLGVIGRFPLVAGFDVGRSSFKNPLRYRCNLCMTTRQLSAYGD